MTHLRFVVAVTRYGGVVAEIAGWLAESMGAATCTTDSPEFERADRVVLVGSGPEFERLLKRCAAGRHRPPTVLWAFDPFPPPGLPSAVFDRGMQKARWADFGRRLHTRLGDPLGRPGELGTVKALLRSFAQGSRRRGDNLREAAGGSGDARLAIFTFERMVALERLLRRGQIDEVLVSSPAAARTLASRGIQARYQPVCRHRDLGCDRGLARDIPVLFLGTVRDHRAERLQALTRALAARGVPLTLVERDCFGEDRTKLLNRTRIVVNLHQYPWHFERIRLFLAVANGVLFVSEAPAADPEPFEPGRHFVVAPPEKMADAVVDCLADDARRQAMNAAASTLYAQQDDFSVVASRIVGAAYAEP